MNAVTVRNCVSSLRFDFYSKKQSDENVTRTPHRRCRVDVTRVRIMGDDEQLEVHTATLSLPVAVAGGLRTTGAALLLGGGVHVVGVLLQNIPALLLGAVEATLRRFGFLQRLFARRRPAGCSTTTCEDAVHRQAPGHDASSG